MYKRVCKGNNIWSTKVLCIIYLCCFFRKPDKARKIIIVHSVNQPSRQWQVVKRTSQGQLLVWTKLLTARPGHAGNKIQYFIKTHVTHTPCGTSPSQTKRKKATADCVMLLLLSHAGPTFKSDFVLLALDSPLPISHFPHVFPRFPIRISMHRGKYPFKTCFWHIKQDLFFLKL